MSRFFYNTVRAVHQKFAELDIDETQTINGPVVTHPVMDAYAQGDKRPLLAILPRAMVEVDFGRVFYNSFLTRYTQAEFSADVFGGIIQPLSLVITLPLGAIALALLAIAAAIAAACSMVLGLGALLTGQFADGFTFLFAPVILAVCAAIVIPLTLAIGFTAEACNMLMSWTSLVTSSVATAGAGIADLFQGPAGGHPHADEDEGLEDDDRLENVGRPRAPTH